MFWKAKYFKLFLQDKKYYKVQFGYQKQKSMSSQNMFWSDKPNHFGNTTQFLSTPLVVLK